MSSSHVLIGRGAGRGTSATLEAGHLRIQQGPQCTLIPLAAVQEARAGDELLVEVVLTDGAVHRVSGRNPTATAAFAAALNRALPQDRDPAGSALVTTGSTSEGEEPLWRGDDASASLGTDRLRIVRGSRSTDIPLAAVQEARVEGGRLLQVVLTDGATHQLPGGKPAATAAFAAALNDALPGERDPAGSARATTESVSGGKPLRTPWRSAARPAAVVLAYLGYTVWAGVTHGAFVAVSVAASGIPFFLGLAALVAGVFATSVRVAMARRGITVQAVRAADPEGRPYSWYEYTATDGVTYAHHTRKHTTPTLHVVYDALRPYRTIVPGSFLPVVVKYTAAFACVFAMLALAVFVTYETFR
ncbi:hypothetical protein ABT024_31160 [Streptomyces sp. NPDC002812]|uniref:hypothetical protein n=1 Tax=Streptomyces sp. NPDC002812 TaxID=3154434 RepID=UPI003325A9A8